MSTRTTIAAGAAVVAVTGSVAAALVLSGGSAAALPARTLTTEVVAAPTVVQLAPATTVTAPAPAKPAAARPAAVKAARTVQVVRAAAKAAPSPVAAPKPATKPVAAPKPAPKPAATTAPAPAPKTGGDDYPWRTSAGTAADTWGFTQRQCVSFAAFRLAQHGDTINNSQGWGSALNWDDTAKARGVTISSTPRVGAIAQWNAGEGSSVAGGGRFTAGSYGHVGYVAAVYADGTALIEQYNLGGDRSYASLRMTAPRYLLF